MDYMHELKEKLCDELEEIAHKGELGAGDLEIIHKLTDTIKNIKKIDALNGGYSRDYARDYAMDGDWEARGNYDRGNSYRNRKRDSMGRYARDGRYPRADAKDHMMEQMEGMMQNASGREKEVIRRAMEQLENM